jgi:hypothetical protein
MDEMDRVDAVYARAKDGVQVGAKPRKEIAQ